MEVIYKCILYRHTLKDDTRRPEHLKARHMNNKIIDATRWPVIYKEGEDLTARAMRWAQFIKEHGDEQVAALLVAKELKARKAKAPGRPRKVHLWNDSRKAGKSNELWIAPKRLSAAVQDANEQE